jgi:hypothetical protein
MRQARTRLMIEIFQVRARVIDLTGTMIQIMHHFAEPSNTNTKVYSSRLGLLDRNNKDTCSNKEIYAIYGKFYFI